MSIVCPNKNSKEWKDLVNRFGTKVAWAVYTRAGDNIPSLREALRIVDSLGIKYEPISLQERQALGVADKYGRPTVFSDYSKALAVANRINSQVPELRAQIGVSERSTGGKVLNNITVTRYVLPEAKAPVKTMYTPTVTDEYQLTREYDRDPEAALTKIIVGWMNKVGLTYNPTDVIYDVDGNPISAVAKADMFRKIVSVVEGKADISTLSEECAHMLVHMMGDNPLVERMRNVAVKTQMYSKVKAEYSEVYNNDENKIINETVGKLIAQEVIRIWDKSSNEYTEESAGNVNAFKKFFDRLIKFIKDLFGMVNFSSEVISEDMAPFTESALMLLNKQTTGLTRLTNADKNDYYYELDSRMQATQRDIVNYFNTIPIHYDTNLGKYVKADGTPVGRRVSDLVHNAKKRIFNIWGEQSVGNPAYALKGTVLHKWNEIIMKDILEGKDSDYYELHGEVFRALKNIPDFAGYTPGQLSNIIKLDEDENQYDILRRGVKKVYDNIMSNQAYINKQTGTQGTPTIITEQIIYDEERDLAGTCDLLVVYSNGTIGIYDYKGISMKTVKGKVVRAVSENLRQAYDVQLTQYKNIVAASLRREAIKNGKDTSINFAEARVIPINMQLNWNKAAGAPSPFGFRKIEMMNPSKDYLMPLPSTNEETHNPKLNKSLVALMATRDSQRKAAHDKPTKENKARLARTEKLIDAILVNQDFSYALDEMFEIQKIFNTRKSIPNGTEGALDHVELKELNDRLSVLSNFLDQVASTIDEIGDDDLTNRLNQAIGVGARLKTDFSQAIQDLLRENTGVDITEPGPKLGFFQRWFRKLSEQSHPVFQAFSKLVKGAQDKFYNDMVSSTKIISDRTIALREWAEKNNMTLQDAFNKLINKEKGTLINKVKKSFYDDFNASREKGTLNANWILHHFEVARDKKTVFKYTGKALEDFEAANKKWQDTLAKHEGLHDEDFYNKLYFDWRSTHDVSFNKDALYNPKNRFISTKYVKGDTISDYYTDEYKYIAENKPLFDYYNMYIDFNREFADITGREIGSKFIANVRQDLIDSLFQSGPAALGKLGNILLQSFETRDESDIVYKSKEDAMEVDYQGNPIKHVPVFYIDPLRSSLTKKEIKAAEDIIDPSIPKDTDDWKRARSQAIRKLQLAKGVTEKSYDLSRVLITLTKSVYTYKHMKTIEAAAQNLLASAKTNMVNTSIDDNKPYMNRFKDKVLSAIGLQSDDIATLEKYIDLYVYGKTSQDGGKTFTVGGREFSWNLVLRKNIQWAAASTLGLKPVLGVRNYVQNVLNFYLQAAEGKYFTVGDFKAAEVLKKSDPLKYQAIIEHFHIGNKDLWKEKAMELSANKINKIINLENMFILLEKTDNMIDRRVLTSMMYEWGWDSNKQRIVRVSKVEGAKRLADLFEVDNITGEYKLNEVTKGEAIRFRAMAQAAATTVKGIMPAEDSYLAGTTVAGSLVMLYRNWMPGLLQTRWKSLDYDPVTQEYDVGRFLVGFKEFSSSGAEIGKAFVRLFVRSLPIIGVIAGRNLGQNEVAARKQYDEYFAAHPTASKTEFTFDDFLQLRLNKLKALAYEFQSIVILFLLAMASKGLIPEPEDKDDNYFMTLATQNLYRSLYGSFLEASFFVNFASAQDIITSPTAMIGHINNITGFFNNIVDETRDLITGEDYKGFLIWDKDSRDKRGPFYFTTRLLPGANAAQDFFNLYDTFTTNMR